MVILTRITITGMLGRGSESFWSSAADGRTLPEPAEFSAPSTLHPWGLTRRIPFGAGLARLTTVGGSTDSGS